MNGVKHGSERASSTISPPSNAMRTIDDRLRVPRISAHPSPARQTYPSTPSSHHTRMILPPKTSLIRSWRPQLRTFIPHLSPSHHPFSLNLTHTHRAWIRLHISRPLGTHPLPACARCGIFMSRVQRNIHRRVSTRLGPHRDRDSNDYHHPRISVCLPHRQAPSPRSVHDTRPNETFFPTAIQTSPRKCHVSGLICTQTYRSRTSPECAHLRVSSRVQLPHIPED